MGRRRIRLLQKNFDFEIIGYDLIPERRDEIKRNFNIETVSSLDELSKTKDLKIAFICSSPATHLELIKKIKPLKLNIFCELNLISKDLEELIDLFQESSEIFFSSNTLNFRKEFQLIKHNISSSQTLVNYSYEVGQYLPDWHPWESYLDFFVSEIKTNAIREILAIELPWIVNTFGNIKEFKVNKSSISKLNLQYPDNYQIIFKHNSGSSGYIGLDLVSRVPIRNLRIYGEFDYIKWQGTPNSLEFYNIHEKSFENPNLKAAINKQEDYADFIVEDAYLDEIKYFLTMVKENKVNDTNNRKLLEILKLIDDLEAEQ